MFTLPPFLRRQESRRSPAFRTQLNVLMACPGGFRAAAERFGASTSRACCVVPACAGMTEGAVGMTEGRRGRREGCVEDGGGGRNDGGRRGGRRGWCGRLERDMTAIARSLTPTPHLTSPLKESPAKCPISADPPIWLYLVGPRLPAPDPLFCRRPLKGGRDELGRGHMKRLQIMRTVLRACSHFCCSCAGRNPGGRLRFVHSSMPWRLAQAASAPPPSGSEPV